ncbi:MAG: MFS transporter, partial [Muribaculaceae bacterium]|nr:MFS transporter [Muribaculaceae bacterium]
MTSNTSLLSTQRKTNYRWVICSMLLIALVINYLDRQVLSLTWEEFIKPEFNWSKGDYGLITGVFSLVYAVAMLFAGRMIDYLGTKRGYAVAIGVWSAGACLHTLCGIMTCGIVTGDWIFSFTGSSEHIHSAVEASAALAMSVTTVSVWLFIVARVVLSIGEAGNFPSSIKAVAEYFPKKDRGFATGIFNSGAQIGALVAPFVILPIAAHFGWEMSFFIIGML